MHGRDCAQMLYGCSSREIAMFRSRMIAFTMALVVVLMVGGCANLGAVRDFAASSTKLTDYKGVTDRYATSADRQLLDLPPGKRFDQTRKNLEELKQVSARDKETLLRLHATTTGYMAALAGLAGDGAYSVSDELGKVSGAITASKELSINADHVKAYANIVAKLADWLMAAQQAKDVKKMVKENGADMDKLLEAMEFATMAYGVVLEQEAKSSRAVAEYRDIPWAAEMKGDVNLTAERREVLTALIRKSRVSEVAEQDAALKAQKAALRGLQEVRRGHRTMLDNVDRLTAKDVQALLKKAASDLKSIRSDISDL